MSEEAPKPGVAGPWPILDLESRRVLGVLVEKAKTTPDAYPLSLNALVTGCNQKSNRDPVMNLDEDDVTEALGRCRAHSLVVKVVGSGRVERWRHLLYEQWSVSKVELAILAELLLRGPQTEGELRTRASRMEPIDDLDALRRQLEPLVERNLVVYLTPGERRGAVLTHGFHARDELERLIAHHSSHAAQVAAPAPVIYAPAPAPPASAPRSDERVSKLESALETLRSELGGLRQELALTRQKATDAEKLASELRASLSATQEELRVLKQSLGG